VRLATRGRRETEHGVETIGDTWLVGQLKRQAREVVAESALGAALVTGIALMLPG
jgi:hypothetical protein